MAASLMFVSKPRLGVFFLSLFVLPGMWIYQNQKSTMSDLKFINSFPITIASSETLLLLKSTYGACCLELGG